MPTASADVPIVSGTLPQPSIPELVQSQQEQQEVSKQLPQESDSLTAGSSEPLVNKDWTPKYSEFLVAIDRLC